MRLSPSGIKEIQKLPEILQLFKVTKLYMQT